MERSLFDIEELEFITDAVSEDDVAFEGNCLIVIGDWILLSVLSVYILEVKNVNLLEKNYSCYSFLDLP